MVTLQEIKDYYKEVFYIENDTLLDVLVAIAISCKNLNSDSIWLLVIGPPSGGKTEFVNVLSGLPYAFQVSTLTENAFLSGMGGDPTKEKSLLHKMGNKGAMLIMKDFTSILSLKEELRKKILGDMREIYEGKITKSTGNGKDAVWKGKINFVGAVTDAIYMCKGDDASMGRRTMDYIMPDFNQATRIKMAKRSSKNISDIAEKREKITKVFAEYIDDKQKDMPKILPPLSDELIDELITIADFSTKMRTATERDFHGNLLFTPGNELPMRMSNQIMTLAQVLMWMNDGALKDEHKKILIKIAFDSISQQRRITLRVMAQYDRVGTAGIAQALGYPTKTVSNWLEDLCVLKACSRETINNRLIWTLNKDYKELVQTHDNVKFIGGDLIGDEDSSQYYGPESYGDADPGVIKESSNIADQQFNDLFG